MKWTVIATWKMAAEGVKLAETALREAGTAEAALTTVITNVENDPRFHSVGSTGWGIYGWRHVIGRCGWLC